VLILDSGGVSRLAERSQQAVALILALREAGLWPPKVPSVVLVECLEGHAGRDAAENRFSRRVTSRRSYPNLSRVARRYCGGVRAAVRRRCTRGGVRRAGGTVLTSDPHDLQALAARAEGVAIVRI